jgi:uncharacterized protein (DUF2384 family)
VNNQDAKFVARVFNEILHMDASTFRLPKRKQTGAELSADVQAAARYGVVLDQDGTMFGSVQAAREYINAPDDGNA